MYVYAFTYILEVVNVKGNLGNDLHEV